MSFQDRQQKRSYTYRIPLDDRKALRKIHRLDVLDTGYCIHEIPDREIPNSGAAQHWSYVFYESKETRDFETDEIQGGTIPGLHKYRYSLDWKPLPHDTSLEMRHANGGGSKIKGQLFVGTSDPRIPDTLSVDFTVSWTPGEIEDMFDGEPVPDKKNYNHDPPEIPAKEARQQFRRALDLAQDNAFKEAQQAVYEYEENCDHDHVVETDKDYGTVAFCEDCGRDWEQMDEVETLEGDGELTIVGEV